MRAWALLVVACVGSAQDLPPEVLLLARIKTHMREELAHLPNYTCLETIARFRKGRLVDTVRLEIVYSDRQEWYGSPGDRNLSAKSPIGFVGSGMIGDGVFALTLHNILEAATFTYRGEDATRGRMTVKYDFHLSRLLKGLEISIAGGIGTAGEEGSLWADPNSLDLVRLEARADEIPLFLPLEETSTKVSYARTRIGEYNVLLPQQGELHMLETSGAESYDDIEFTHCRAFSARSAISFGEEPLEPSKAVPPEQPSGQAVPAFLPVTVLLTTPITDKDAVGTLIEGKVSGDVVHKGKIAIPDGSVVRGRIRRLERWQESRTGEFIVGLEFTEVEVSGRSLRFYADFLRTDRNPRIRPTLTERVPVRQVTITLPELPGVASFFVSGTAFTIPSGFRMMWRTRGLIR